MDREERLANLIAELLDRQNRGEAVDPAAEVRNHPEFRDELLQFLNCRDFFADALRPSRTELAPLPDDGEERLDLARFQIRRRLEDHALGAMYLLVTPLDQPPRELIVVRGWFTPEERYRVERQARFAMRLAVRGILPIVDFGRLNQVPFFIRRHAVGAPIPALAAVLRDGSADSPSDAWRHWRHVLGAVGGGEDGDPAQRMRRAEALAQSRRHLKETVSIIAAFAETLQSAHAEGHTHRGLEPADLAIDADGRPEIRNMGAVWTGTGVEARRMRSIDFAAVAPEARGAIRAPVTWLADVFSLAYAALSLLTLDMSKEHDPECADEFVVEKIRSLPESLPGALRAALLAGLAEEPSDRPADVIELARSFLSAVGLKHPEPFLPDD